MHQEGAVDQPLRVNRKDWVDHHHGRPDDRPRAHQSKQQARRQPPHPKRDNRGEDGEDRDDFAQLAAPCLRVPKIFLLKMRIALEDEIAIKRRNPKNRQRRKLDREQPIAKWKHKEENAELGDEGGLGHCAMVTRWLPEAGFR